VRVFECKELKFHLLRASDLSRVNFKRVSERDDRMTGIYAGSNDFFTMAHVYDCSCLSPFCHGMWQAIFVVYKVV
jgi:hypothetical protein